MVRETAIVRFNSSAALNVQLDIAAPPDASQDCCEVQDPLPPYLKRPVIIVVEDRVTSLTYQKFEKPGFLRKLFCCLVCSPPIAPPPPPVDKHVIKKYEAYLLEKHGLEVADVAPHIAGRDFERMERENQQLLVQDVIAINKAAKDWVALKQKLFNQLKQLKYYYFQESLPLPPQATAPRMPVWGEHTMEVIVRKKHGTQTMMETLQKVTDLPFVKGGKNHRFTASTVIDVLAAIKAKVIDSTEASGKTIVVEEAVLIQIILMELKRRGIFLERPLMCQSLALHPDDPPYKSLMSKKIDQISIQEKALFFQAMMQSSGRG
jgi:hypothetical protein